MNQKVISKDHFSIKILNFIFSGVIILSNIFVFIPYTSLILKTGGGPFAFGILLLPFQIIAHLFLISAILSLNNKHHYHRTYTWLNGIGAIGVILWSVLILTSIKSYQSLF